MKKENPYLKQTSLEGVNLAKVWQEGYDAAQPQVDEVEAVVNIKKELIIAYNLGIDSGKRGSYFSSAKARNNHFEGVAKAQLSADNAGKEKEITDAYNKGYKLACEQIRAAEEEKTSPIIAMINARWQKRMEKLIRKEHKDFIDIVLAVAKRREDDGFGSQNGWVQDIKEFILSHIGGGE